MRAGPTAQPVTCRRCRRDLEAASWTRACRIPLRNSVYGKFEQPVAESKYIVRVKSKAAQLAEFSLFRRRHCSILPAHVLKNVNGATYVRDYNFKLLPGSGPVHVSTESDVVKGQELSHAAPERLLGREVPPQRRARTTSTRSATSSFAIDNLAFEMFKKRRPRLLLREHLAPVGQELNFDRVQRGVIQKRKVFNDNPNGISGHRASTRARRRSTTSESARRSRTCFNRELLIEKLFYQRVPCR